MGLLFTVYGLLFTVYSLILCIEPAHARQSVLAPLLLLNCSLTRLLEDHVEEGAEGDGDAGTTDPEAGGLANLAVLSLGGVGLYIEDVALLHIIIR